MFKITVGLLLDCEITFQKEEGVEGVVSTNTEIIKDGNEHEKTRQQVKGVYLFIRTDRQGHGSVCRETDSWKMGKVPSVLGATTRTLLFT